MSHKELRSSDNSDMQVSFSTQQDRCEYIVAKLERVSQALYLLTNYLPDNEPFKISIRQKAMDLIGELYDVQNQSAMNWLTLVRMVDQTFNELRSMLTIGVKAGLMSEMNYSVLNEQMSLIQSLTSDTSHSNGHTLKDSFFQTSKGQSNGHLIDTSQSTIEEQQKDNNRSFNKFSPTANSTGDDRSESLGSNKSFTTSRRRHGTNHSKRRRAILGLFRDKDEIDINDVQSVIEGCSQKTMQRELKSMVTDRLIEKRGKRRWSSYVLEKGVNLDQELN